MPVYKLLGGKVRDQVRVYNGGVRFPMTGQRRRITPRDVAKMKAAKEGFTIIKQAIGFHSADGPRGARLLLRRRATATGRHPNRGLLTEQGLKHIIACVEAMKEVLGDEVGLALDCGPGWMRARRHPPGQGRRAAQHDVAGGHDHRRLHALRHCRRLPRGDAGTSTPIHTGEQIYLRQNFKELIEKQAVRIIGPDPGDVGGIAELKWIAEYADLHGILMAPHGIFDGADRPGRAGAGLAPRCPQNYIAFEYPVAKAEWWYDIVEGLPDPIVKNSLIDVWDRPGLGVEIKVEKARKYLGDGDERLL